MTLVFKNLFVFKNRTLIMIFNAKYTLNTIGNAILKYHHPSAYPFVKVYALITIRRIFSIKKSTATEIKSLYFLILEKTSYFAIKIGANIIVSPKNTDNAGIQNQLPPV